MSIQEKAKERHITIRFCLAPEYCDENYKDHLLHAIKEKYENKTFKDFGYILEVLSIHKILREEIMSILPNVFFMVEIVVLLYSPIIGEKLMIEIDKIFHHGIFMMENKIRILVPITSLSGPFVIQKDFSSFFLMNTQTQSIYRRKDRIEVELIEIRFEKDGFSCIGSLC